MRIAVLGPIFSGKTSLGQALEERYKFEIINFTDSLKWMGKMALHAAGLDVTVEEIKRDKERFRPFLQHLGTLTGFDAGKTIPNLLLDHFRQYGPNADYYFDNVRFIEQWEALQSWGFQLVQLRISREEQERRALANGVSLDTLRRALEHPAEQGFETLCSWVDVDTMSPAEIASAIVYAR